MRAYKIPRGINLTLSKENNVEIKHQSIWDYIIKEGSLKYRVINYENEDWIVLDSEMNIAGTKCTMKVIESDRRKRAFIKILTINQAKGTVTLEKAMMLPINNNAAAQKESSGVEK